MAPTTVAERLGPLLKVLHRLDRERVLKSAGVVVFDLRGDGDDLLGMGQRQRPQRRVEQAVQRRVRAEADRQRQDGRGRERLVRPEEAECVVEVPHAEIVAGSGETALSWILHGAIALASIPMAKALFLGLPLHGHTNPSLPLVRALVERGDEVVYFSSEAFAARIQQAGARYRPYRNAFLADLRQLSERTDKISWLLMRTTGEVLANELDAFRAERPDYIISDSVAPWGQWVGQMLDVPVVTSVTTFAVNRHVLAFAASRGTRPKSARLVLSKIRHVAKAALLGRRLRREHGVRGTGIMGLMFGSSDLNIVYTSRHFQPCAETFRRSLPVHRAVNRFTDRNRRLPVGRRVAGGRDLCLAGHAVQRGSGVLPDTASRRSGVRMSASSCRSAPRRPKRAWAPRPRTSS